MFRSWTRLAALLVPLALPLAACSSSGAKDPAEPAFGVQLFSGASETVTHPHFPLVPGTIRVYLAEGEDEATVVVVEVLDETRGVAGVTAAVVRVRVYEDDELVEEARRWYAQDDAGNVWALGAEVVHHEYDDDGNVVSTDDEGSWEAGVDVAGTGTSAVAGIVMKATLQAGDTYAEARYAGVVEDMGQIVALGVVVTLADGSSHTCVQVRGFTPLDPDEEQYRYFAPGVGLVMTSAVDGSESTELRGTFDGTLASLPDRAAATFSHPTVIAHPFLPFEEDRVLTYAAPTEDGVETVVLELLDTTRVVDGVECAVVRDRVFLDGELIEDTHDWFASDDAGNVWYFGEEVVNYEYDDDGNLLGTDDEGSWEAGVDGARPGILVPAAPAVGVPFRQEYREDEAEDMAVVVATGVTVELATGRTFAGCVQTLEWNPLEPSGLEYKFAAPGVGVVLEVSLTEGERLDYLGTFDTGDASLADRGAATFSSPTSVTHAFFPLAPGTTLEYEVETDDGVERIVAEVLATTRVVDGVECAVVRVREFLEGEIVEDTHDWFAQDDAGNVWYFGEEVVNYEYDDDGNLLGTDDGGSWEAGVDGAEAGIQLWAVPVIGESYYQEFYEDEAEDLGIVVATGVTVALEDGTVHAGCLQTLEWTPLEPEAIEFKWYAPGVGLVAEQDVFAEERVELVDGP